MNTDNDVWNCDMDDEAAYYPARRLKYTPKRMERICEALEAGESLRSAAAAEGVDKASVYRWCRKDAAVADKFARAYDMGLRRWQDRLLEICEELQEAGDNKRHGAQRVAALKLEADTIKWTLSHRTRRAVNPTQPDEASKEVDTLLLEQEREDYAHRHDFAEFMRFVKEYAKKNGGW